MADRYRDRYRGESYGRDRHRPDERGFMDRAGDEVRSWFGDDDAARRRERDVRHERYAERGRPDDPDRYSGEFSGSSREFDPSWERRGGYGPGDAGSSGYRGAGPAWRHEPSTDESYRGYTRSAGERGGYRDRAVGNRDRSDAFDEDGRLIAGYQYPPAAAPRTLGDTGGRGRFTGRGPKGYQRSDERIREDVCDRLSDDPDVDASEIEVLVNRGEVTLSGMVRSREDKRHAEDLIERISGVREVHNTLRVNRADAGTPGSVLGVSPAPDSPGRSGTDVNTPGTRR